MWCGAWFQCILFGGNKSSENVLENSWERSIYEEKYRILYLRKTIRYFFSEIERSRTSQKCSFEQSFWSHHIGHKLHVLCKSARSHQPTADVCLQTTSFVYCILPSFCTKKQSSQNQGKLSLKSTAVSQDKNGQLVLRLLVRSALAQGKISNYENTCRVLSYIRSFTFGHSVRSGRIPGWSSRPLGLVSGRSLGRRCQIIPPNDLLFFISKCSYAQ